MGFSLGELFISLGFDVDDAKLKNFKGNLRDTHEEMVKLGTVAATSLAALTLFVQKSADGAVRLNNMASMWGANTQAAQTFANALHQVNSQVSVAAGLDKYRSFAEMINAKVPQGGGAYAALARLGSKNPWGSPEENLEQIREYLGDPAHRESIGGHDPKKQRAIISDLLGQIGLSDSIGAILEPNSEYQAAGKYNIQQDVIENLSKFAKSTAEFDEAMNKFSTDMAGEIGPKLVKVVEFFTRALNFVDEFNTNHPNSGAVPAELSVAGIISGWLTKKVGANVLGGFAGRAMGVAGAGVEFAGAAGAIATGAWYGLSAEQSTFPAIAAWLNNKGTRGARNNNPGNIKYGPFAQRHGATGVDGQGFAIFPSVSLGTTAISALLSSYAGQHIDTIHGIVGRYTQGDSADTQKAYERSLSGLTGHSAGDHLNMTDPNVLSQLISGIIRQENGLKGNVNISVHSNATDNREVADLVAQRFQHVINTAYAQTDLGAQQ